MKSISIWPNRVMRRTLLTGAVLTIGALGHAGAAAMPQAIHARQAQFRRLGRFVKSLRDHSDWRRPDWAVIASETNQIQRLASALPAWFPAGSGRGHGVRTRARSAIWKKPEQFARIAHVLLLRAQNLRTAATSRNLRALRLGTRELGEVCDSCHRRFRARRGWW